MAELMENGSKSERIHEAKGKDNAIETNYNNKITSTDRNANKIKNSAGNSNALGLFRNHSCEKESFSTELRLGMAIEEHCDEEMGLPSWIRSVHGGAPKRGAVGQLIPRLDLSSVGSSSNSINLFPSQSGFGSPIELTAKFDRRTLSDHHQDDCSGFVTSFRPAESMIPGKQSSPQLTIFYGGMVNVYDDIPADKAQAIMLIASSGSYSSDQHTKVQNGCGSQTEQKISVPAAVKELTEESGIPPQPAIRKVHTDLPIARKHSLQRFLEKRKDRMNANAKSTYTTAKAENMKPQRYPSSSPIWLHSNSPP